MNSFLLADQVKMKYKYLRNTFNKCRNKQEPSGSAATKEPKWEFFHLLEFLVPVSEQVPRSSSVKTQRPSSVPELEPEVLVIHCNENYEEIDDPLGSPALAASPAFSALAGSPASPALAGSPASPALAGSPASPEFDAAPVSPEFDAAPASPSPGTSSPTPTCRGLFGESSLKKVTVPQETAKARRLRIEKERQRIHAELEKPDDMKDIVGKFIEREEKRWEKKKEDEQDRRRYEEEREAKRQRCNPADQTMTAQIVRTWMSRITDPDLDAEAAVEVQTLLARIYQKQREMEKKEI